MNCSNRRVASLLFAIGLAAGCAATPALAHKASEAYLELRAQPNATAVRWDIALRDLDLLLDFDADGDGSLRWGEVEGRKAALADYAARQIELSSASGRCAGSPRLDALARRDDANYAVLLWHADCPRGEPPSGLRYRFLAGVDASHRVIVSLPGADVEWRALRAADETQPIELGRAPRSAGRHDFIGFFSEGMRHILHGSDHLAFLIALLIPAIAVAGAAGHRLRTTLADLLETVSVFTLAHSITLGLTALGLIGLPSRWVESIVALSVVAGGAHALRVAAIAAIAGGAGSTTAPAPATTAAAAPAPAKRCVGGVPLWLVFAFGLIHGIGFGSALQDAGLAGRAVIAALSGFNIGVEAGQLAVLAVAFPLAWTLRDAGRFRQLSLPACALLIIGFGANWFADRALG